jgi:hypothetical protein
VTHKSSGRLAVYSWCCPDPRAGGGGVEVCGGLRRRRISFVWGACEALHVRKGCVSKAGRGIIRFVFVRVVEV